MNEKLVAAKADYPKETITSGLQSLISSTKSEIEELKRRQKLALEEIAAKRKVNLDQEHKKF